MERGLLKPASGKRSQVISHKLNPAAGIVDDGNGNGRHANKNKKKQQN